MMHSVIISKKYVAIGSRCSWNIHTSDEDARDELFKFLLPGALTYFKWADMSAKLKIGYNCVIVFSKQVLKQF